MRPKEATAPVNKSRYPKKESLVVSFNPFQKYARQIGSFPQVEVNIKNIWNHHLKAMSYMFDACELWQ